MKEVFMMLALAGVIVNGFLFTYKLVEHRKLTKEIKFDMFALEGLRNELADYCLPKLQAMMIWLFLFGIITYYF